MNIHVLDTHMYKAYHPSILMWCFIRMYLLPHICLSFVVYRWFIEVARVDVKALKSKVKSSQKKSKS